MTRPKTGLALSLDLQGEDGNAYVILANVAKIVRQVLGKEAEREYLHDAKAADYKQLLAVTNEYVELREVRRFLVTPVDAADQSCDECTVWHREGHA